MKKFLLLSLALTTWLFSFSQQRVTVKKSQKLKSVKAYHKTAIDDQIVEKPVNYSTAVKGVVDVNETQIGDTYYGLWTNCSMANRIYLYDDGTIGAVWTRGAEASSFPDRGTGYNYFDGTSWGTMPTARIETVRTGWPSYAPWCANGELFTAHGPMDGLLLATCPNKGTDDWTESRIVGPADHEDLVWPRTVTAGTDHNTIHCIALTNISEHGGSPYLGQDGALVYNRSSDGGANWDIENEVIEGLGADYFHDIGGDTYAWAEPQGDTLAFIVADKWHDMVLMKSLDGGDNWIKTVIYEFPIPLWYFGAGQDPLDTTFVCDGSAAICLDKDGMAHVAFGIVRVMVTNPGAGSYTYFPYCDGIGYWNENMPTWTDGDQYHALDPDALYETDNLIGWTQDVDGNGSVDFLNDGFVSYRGSGISTMPNIIADDYGYIFLSYSSTTEGFDNGTHNYKHIWLRGYDGYQWGDFLDIDNGIAHMFHECVYPNLAQNSDADNIYLIYQADEFPGLAFSGDHDYVNNFIYNVKVSKADLVTTHFIPVWTENPYQPMTIIVNSADINGSDLQAGDEIGIFGNDGSGNLICVGVGKLSTSITPGNPLQIVVSADDPTTNIVDGFINGDSIIYKLWNSGDQMEFSNVSASYNPDFDQVFAPLGTAIVELTGYAHYQTIWAGNPYQPMNILISSSTINGADLNIGDEIGIFDINGTGNEICVGGSVVSQAITPGNPLSIIASTDDPSTTDIDGFTSGDTIIYKAWSSGAQTEYSTYQATYNAGFDNVFTPLGTALVDVAFLSYVTQTIELNQGWNIISFYVAPDDMNMLNIVQPLVTSNKLIKVINEAGGFIQYIPSVGWMNTIGDMANTEGYYFKVTNNTTFDVTGMAVTSPFNIPLNQGWNIMGYPFEQSQDALAALQPLITANELIKVINEAGGFIQYIPGVGWMNTIGNFDADKGYYIKVTTNTNLALNTPSKSDLSLNDFSIYKPKYFKKSFNNNPYYPMNILITDINVEGFEIQPLDEVAVYDNKICVGVGVVPEKINQPINIVASLDDPTTTIIDGFSEEHKLTFKYWDKSNNTEYDNIKVFHSYGENKFTGLGTFVGELKIFTTGLQEIEISEATYLGQNFPNPFSNKTTIEYGIANEGNVLLSIYDIYGRKIKILVNEFRKQGKHIITFDRSILKSGLYYYKLEVFNKKIIYRDVKKMIIN